YEGMSPLDAHGDGGEPGGSSSASWCGRSCLRRGIVAGRFGGQGNDTAGDENPICVRRTDCRQFVGNLVVHRQGHGDYGRHSQHAESLKKKDLIEIELENEAVHKAKGVILATGASWRELGIPGDEEFRNKGVAYCPHCDGPIFEGKDVAVVGGGNSGVEAAI